MRVGLIARAERRGLGLMSRDIAKYLKPDKVLIVRPRAATEAGLGFHTEWFDDATRKTIQWNGQQLDEGPCRRWLAGLDVVLMLETTYDPRFPRWCEEARVASVLWVMGEYFPFLNHPDLPRPTAFWSPTCYRIDLLPPETTIVPVPVDLDAFTVQPEHDGPPRWVHVAGARAAADRNGTRIVMDALPLLQREHHVIIRSQGDMLYPQTGAARLVHLETHCTEVAEPAELYEGADVLVMPRRYGGLCMPALEAMASGLALLMPSVEPQVSTWPIIGVDAPYLNHIDTSAGKIPLCAVDPAELAAKMDWVAKHKSVLRSAREQARSFAENNSWEVSGPTIVEALERACG